VRIVACKCRCVSMRVPQCQCMMTPIQSFCVSMRVYACAVSMRVNTQQHLYKHPPTHQYKHVSKNASVTTLSVCACQHTSKLCPTNAFDTHRQYLDARPSANQHTHAVTHTRRHNQTRLCRYLYTHHYYAHEHKQQRKNDEY